MRSVNFRSEAERELTSAYDWYRDRDAHGAAKRLVGQTEAAVSLLERFAHTFPVVHHTTGGTQVRRLLLKKMPYMLVYFIDPENVVQVIAFAHVRRSQYWRGRVK